MSVFGNRISRFRVGGRVDSDHMPMELTVEIRRRRGQGKKTQEQERRKSKVIQKFIWNQETKAKYAEKTRKLCKKEGEVSRESENVEEKWERIKRIVLGAVIKKKIRIKEKELSDRDGGTEEYKKQKRNEKGVLEMEKKEDRKKQICGRMEEVQDFVRRDTKGKKNKGRGRAEEHEKRSRSLEIY